jgi:hypothetical protein
MNNPNEGMKNSSRVCIIPVKIAARPIKKIPGEKIFKIFAIISCCDIS